MPEQIQNILNRISEWWKHFSTRQKAAIISAAAIVIVALVILGTTMSRPTYTTLATATDTKEASEIKSALDGSDTTLDYKVSDDGLTFMINTKQASTARLLLGSNGIPSTGYSIDDALSGSFSTTEADKTKKYQVYLESKLEKDIESIGIVDSASVSLHIPEKDGTLIANSEPSYASVVLSLNDDMSTDQAAGIAQTVATALGNDDTENVTIIDTNGNMLFSGGDAASASVTAATNRTVQEQAQNSEANKVKNLLASSGANGQAIFDNTKISVHLDMDFSEQNSTDYHYYVDEGQTQGYLDSYSTSSSSYTNGVGGTPGTDSNNDTTYVTEDGNYSHSETLDENYDYLPNETITNKKNATGTVNYDDSSVSIIAYNYVVYDEDQMTASNQLNGQTFDEFVAANNSITAATVDPTLITAVSKATNIPEANISFLAYDVPMFTYSSGGRDWTDYLQIILAVLILLLLLFVVIRTFRAPKEEEVEEEVSVEDLIENQEEEGLEDIGMNDKSEARLLIEKFVDENPEAAAALLRNWLNDDWDQ